MKTLFKSEFTHRVDIFIAGNPDTIAYECQKYCEKGLCVTVTSTAFAYKHGQEDGACVGLVNYPRFPTTKEALEQEAVALAMHLLKELSQGSCLIVKEDITLWVTRREQDHKENKDEKESK